MHKPHSFLSQRPLKMYIGGEWVGAASGESFATLDPGTAELITEVPDGDAADIDRAVTAARKAFVHSGWATMPVEKRAEILHRLADLIDLHTDILSQIESLDVGKPVAQARAFDIPHAANTFRYYADLSCRTPRRDAIAASGNDARTVRHPYGVCGFIIPWNFPFLLLGWGAAPALAAGNTVVVKPAEDTPLSAIYFCRLAEEAGLPPGVINVVTGLGEAAGAALARHCGVNRMSFTGSPEVGRLVAEACGRNLIPAKLELGGKGAAVVFDDVNPEQTAEALAAAVTLNTGQVCCTATRWLVHANIHDAFLARAVSYMRGLKIGHGSDTTTQMGPVVSEKQRRRVLGYLEKGLAAGAQSILAGGRAEVPEHPKGYYVKPALLGGPPHNICAREEIFGPAAYVMSFETEEEAVELVNRSPYGLANSVWSSDLSRANRVAERLVAGNSWINAHNLFAHGVPYGGCNLSGCGGGVLGPDTLEDYYRKQSVMRPLA